MIVPRYTTPAQTGEQGNLCVVQNKPKQPILAERAMPLFPVISCLPGRHDPKRRAVLHDGQDYVGKCRHCGKPIRRVSHRKWRLDCQVDRRDTL